MKPNLCGRADLIRALVGPDPALTAALAALLGYQETLEIPRQRSSLSATPGAPSRAAAGEPAETQDQAVDVPLSRAAAGEPAETQSQAVDVPFWYLEAYEAVSLEERPRPTVTSASTIWRRRPHTLPSFTPLAPQRVVLTRLRQGAALRRTTSDVDVEAIVERISQGDLLDGVPYRQRLAWGSELYVIEDRARRLVPYWRDQEWVVERLAGLYPSHGLTITRLGEGDVEPVVRWPEARRGQYVPPLPGAMVLVLGDLGCLARRGEALRGFWLHWGRRLRANQNPAVALVPTTLKAVRPELARLWTVVRWDLAAASPVGSEATSVPRLLTLLAPALRLEPGLLRAVRCLLPAGRADAGLEARVWQDEALASQHSEAAT